MSDTFCPLPFTHLYIRPNGEYQPCCRFANGRSFEKIHSYEDLDSVLKNSKQLNTLRQQMISGQYIPGCKSCYLEEESSGQSMRTGEMDRWGGFDDLYDKEPRVTNVEITFGNYCNLACRICGSGLSTSWQDDDKKISNLYDRHYVPERLNVKKDWNPKDFVNVEKLKVTGGEPMLHPDFLAFLDNIIDSGVAGNIEVQIFTNTSFVPKKHLLDRLSKFKQMGVCLSIDGTGSVQEYSRHNSTWDVVQEATKKWLTFENDYKENVTVNFAPTISLYNIFNVMELVDWFIELRKSVLHDSSTFTNCTWNVTTYPSYMDIKHLPNKEVIRDKLIAYSSKFESNLKSYKELIYRIIDRLNENGNKREIITFVQYNKDLDSLRNQNFVETFPELYSQIKSIWDNVDGKLDK